VLADTGGATVLAATGDNQPLAASYPRGQGKLIVLGVPLGLGIDERPVPVLGELMQHLTSGLVPVKVAGDVEWTLNKLHPPSGGWLVTVINNRGVNKPQHGVNPTDHREHQTVTLTFQGNVTKSNEYLTGESVQWTSGGKTSTTTITIPAGAFRMVALQAN
jgi:hypothetical protein